MRASDRSLIRVANAASSSRLVLALRTWICSPIARAAASTSLNVASVPGALVGSTSTAIRMAPGTSSRRSSNRFDASSVLKALIPDARPGEARNRVYADKEDDGDRRGGRLGREHGRDTSDRG